MRQNHWIDRVAHRLIHSRPEADAFDGSIPKTLVRRADAKGAYERPICGGIAELTIERPGRGSGAFVEAIDLASEIWLRG